MYSYHQNVHVRVFVIILSVFAISPSCYRMFTQLHTIEKEKKEKKCDLLLYIYINSLVQLSYLSI